MKSNAMFAVFIGWFGGANAGIIYAHWFPDVFNPLTGWGNVIGFVLVCSEAAVFSFGALVVANLVRRGKCAP